MILSPIQVSGLLLQVQGNGVNVDVNPAFGLVGSAISAFLTTLLVGAILVALAPKYTEKMMDRVRAEPIGSAIYGIVLLVLLLLVMLILVITIIGILFAIPLGIVVFVAWAIGAAIAYLAIAERLVGLEDGWLKPLLVGAAINGGLALTGIGGIVSFCIGAAGFGAVLRNWLS
ncbi:hypothetical protein [Haloarchaeobius sp. HME9146]|uniref:hypothetical protein n=1 Tax=Haloarchaeobius sp. HME9146 TaxID=2978732 RepID=UPI0021BF4E8D|nr:hypothetical protein [Haloarchaeobius sp. HME9146]MCT9095512.1 hypothetical protein [Haloarchaeobius sp. HME9146]